MDHKHLDALIAIERTYWWHVAKRALVLGLLRKHAPPPGRLVEGGVGGGANLLAYRDLGYEVTGFDLIPESVEHCRGLGLEDVRVHNLQEPWPVPPRSARAAVLLDVIEHVAEPALVLRNAADLLGAGGKVIVTVPAIPSLMGPWDEMLGHYRRYSPRLLREHAREAGLKVRWLSYWNSFALPPALVIRGLEKRRGGRRSAEFPPVSPFMNATLKGLAAAERGWMRLAPVPAGLSLAAVLEP